MKDESSTLLSVGNRKIQDSMFRFVFNAPREACELAHTLGLPVSEDDLQILTVSRVLTSGIEDDLAFAIGERAIVMIEAQTTSPVNIPYRMLGYCAEAVRSYVEKHNRQDGGEHFNEYSGTKVKIPPFRLFAICPHLKNGPHEVCLYEDEQSDLGNIRVQIITDAPEGSLLCQYLQFCRKYKELLETRCSSRERFDRLLRWCREKNILWEYVARRKEEVNALLTADYVRARQRQADVLQGLKKGIAKGKAEGMAQGMAQGKAEGLETAYNNMAIVLEFSNRAGHPEWLSEFLQSRMDAEQFIKMKTCSLAE